VSGVIVIETDSSEAEAWAQANLSYTPMMTGSARGRHRYYRRPGHAPLPAAFTVNTLTIEIKRDGQYVVAPGSVHPSGHVYTEVEPWPESLEAVPEFSPVKLPPTVLQQFLSGRSNASSKPLPGVVPDGGRNDTLFREGCRLRQRGLQEPEIFAALVAINTGRCHPPLDRQEVETIARGCARYEVPADTFPTTETGDAEVFAACNADTVRYDHLRGRWLLFDGNVWVPQTDGQIARLALETVRARQRAAVGDKDRMRWAIIAARASRSTAARRVRSGSYEPAIN
jgi:Primase C terminal 1 (PriCT-1)/Bifunctional DNA primase/polymerase, N-terminal